MSFNGKKFNDHHGGHKLTPAEKKQKEEDHKRKVEEARKKAEVDAAAFINHADVCLKEIKGTKSRKIPENINEIYNDQDFIKKLEKDLALTISFFVKFSNLQTEASLVFRPLLCEETTTEFTSRLNDVNTFTNLMKTTYKDKIYATMDASLSAKNPEFYINVLHPLIVKSHDVQVNDGIPMLTWSECTDRFTAYEQVVKEKEAPAKKLVIDEHTGNFKRVVESFNKINLQGDPMGTYKDLLRVWTDLIPIIHRQENLDKPKELEKFKASLFGAMATVFAKCEFGKAAFPRCDEETKLHLKAYMTSPTLFNQYQDELEAIRMGAVH